MTAIAKLSGNKVRPLLGSRTRQMQLTGTTGNNGDAVKLNTTSGTVSITANATDKVYGIIAGNSDKVDGTAEAGDMVTIVTFGPCSGWAAGQPGIQAFLSSVAGGLDTAGSVPVGVFEDTDVLIVMPNVSNVGSS